MAEGASFSELPGWNEDNHARIWPVFHTSCQSVLKKKPAPRPGVSQNEALWRVCAEAVRLPEKISNAKAKTFFETHFTPVKLTTSQKGLMTGYYEPEFAASQKRSAQFDVPVLRRPKQLVSNVAPQGHADLTAAFRGSKGTLVPAPDRVAIENGALAREHLEMFWMKDPFDLFTMQVQGSGRLKLEDGTTVRVGYDGKNGYPYTSVGKVLIDRGILQKGNVSMQAIGAVFEKDAALAREVMRENKSYVFFRELKNMDSKYGPLGGQSLALTPLTSIAIDRKIHSYGLPFYISGGLPGINHRDSFNKLVIAQDTGTAIVGEARVDLFVGWGDNAKRLAGVLQEKIDLYILQPKGQH